MPACFGFERNCMMSFSTEFWCSRALCDAGTFHKGSNYRYLVLIEENQNERDRLSAMISS